MLKFCNFYLRLLDVFTLPNLSKGPELQHLTLKHNVAKTQKSICDIISIELFSYILVGLKSECWLQWSAANRVVSVENSVCSIILMAVSNCIMPEQQVALAAGVAALNASPHWPRGFGQGSRVRALSGHRPGSRPMGRGGQQQGAVVVGQMIYRQAG